MAISHGSIYNLTVHFIVPLAFKAELLLASRDDALSDQYPSA